MSEYFTGVDEVTHVKVTSSCQEARGLLRASAIKRLLFYFQPAGGPAGLKYKVGVTFLLKKHRRPFTALGLF